MASSLESDSPTGSGFQRPDGKVSFLVFFLLWAERQRWEVPPIHARICHWLEYRGNLAVLQVWRGCGKSTIIAVYNAWCYYCWGVYRILHQGDQDKTAYKTSRDTKNVLQHHPLTAGYATVGEASFWWTAQGYAADPRNPNMQAAGILSNITSSRADEIQNDDVEVQKNVETPEAREKLRTRLDEQVHIAVPGARHLYIGTPHTHDSLYNDVIELGADSLRLPLFTHEMRYTETEGVLEYALAFIPEQVFTGIGRHTRALVADVDYTIQGTTLTLTEPAGGVLDLYAGNQWPERFTPAEMASRRKKCATLNKWDSQYQLHAKPVIEVRLDPEKLVVYDCRPTVTTANRRRVMMLGNVQIVGISARFDPSTGKPGRDRSVLAIVLTDALGRVYLQAAKALAGDLDQQCEQIRALAIEYQLGRVEVETNGIGGFVVPILRKHLAGTGCAAAEVHSSQNKNTRILEAWEAPLSSGFMWAHVDVLTDATDEDPEALSELWQQMLQWNPKVKDQGDDYLDAVAGAISATPVRIGKTVGNPKQHTPEHWQPNHGTHIAAIAPSHSRGTP